MRRITVSLFESERDALHALAQIERRDTRQQAALLIREALQQRGLLPEAQTAVPGAGVQLTLFTDKSIEANEAAADK